MTALTAGIILLALLLVLLVAGVWIAISLAAVAWFGLQFFTSTPPDVNLFQSFWGSSASWTLAALPLFVWMGEILFRTRLSQDMFRGLAPWMQSLPGRLLHVNVAGCAIFAAVSGSSAATCATIGRISLPQLLKTSGYATALVGPLAPPSGPGAVASALLVGAGPTVGRDPWRIARCSVVIKPPSQRMAARSRILRSSRTFPGQS